MIDENWYIVGGGDNASGNAHMTQQLVFISCTVTYAPVSKKNSHVAGSTDTIVMNASKFVWSVVTSVSARDQLACEVRNVCAIVFLVRELAKIFLKVR